MWFKKAVEKVGISEQEREARSLQRLMNDFPWLWALRRYWSSYNSNEVRISQDLNDLKIVLSSMSNETSYSLWQVGFAYDYTVIQEMERRDGKRWCQAIMEQTENSVRSILFVVIVDPDDFYGAKNIRIFRHPEKIALNDMIQQVAQLHGASTSWKLVLPD